MDVPQPTGISRRVVLVGLGASGLGLALFPRPFDVSAQDASPASMDHGIHGITLTVLGNGVPIGAPGQVVFLIRGVQEPGAYITPHYHPGAQVFYVDQGAIAFTIHKGDARLVRAGMARPGAAPGTAGEMVPPGTELLLNPGDWLWFERDVVESARNAGDGEAVFLISALYEAGQPLTVFTNLEGTPIPAE